MKPFVLHDIVLIAAGALLLVGVGIVFFNGDFLVWTIAKAIYVIGVLIFLFKG